ncbi:MAG: glycosyltransferase family 2 protein [Mangrovibacterium sp.]
MKISVITATFNSYPSIKDCIHSLVSQQNVDLEHIVIDGGSTDRTLDFIKDSPLRSRIVSEPDRGIYDALNKGIKMATGDVIGFLHSDDSFASPLVLSSLVSEFERTKADGIYGDLVYVLREDTGKIIRVWKSTGFRSWYLKYGWMPAHPTLFLKREVYQKCGQFDLNYKIAADYDFIQRIFKEESLKFAYLPIITTKMKIGGASNKNLKNIRCKMIEDYRIIRKNHVGGWYTLLLKNLMKVNQFIGAGYKSDPQTSHIKIF